MISNYKAVAFLKSNLSYFQGTLCTKEGFVCQMEVPHDETSFGSGKYVHLIRWKSHMLEETLFGYGKYLDMVNIWIW